MFSFMIFVYYRLQIICNPLCCWNFPKTVKQDKKIRYIQMYRLYRLQRIEEFKDLEWFSSISRLWPFLMNATCTCNVEDKWHNYNLLLTYIHTTALKQRYMYAHLTHNLCRVVVSVWVTRKQLTELPLFSSKHFELKYKTLGNVDILFEIEVLQAKSPISSYYDSCNNFWKSW